VRITLLSFFLIVTFGVTHAQEIFKGIVVDSASFAPLPYVSVQLKGTTRGTTTDAKGNFSLFGTQKDTLIFSLIGYARIELPLKGYEASLIRLAERTTMLQAITIHDSRVSANPYEGMFDDRLAALKARIPFYYSRGRKDKIKAGRWREENAIVQTYVDVVINNPKTKEELMKTHGLSEDAYYSILTKFNEKHYTVMYYLTQAELVSLLNRFFESEVSKR
jgi:hypothetical protein